MISGARRLVAAALLSLLVVAGCRVQTTVSVEATSPTTGTVTVAVTLDPTAVATLGGRAALTSELDTADLTAEGWRVSGPSDAGSNVVLQASHGFSSPEEADALLADVAGSGPSSTRPFRLTLSHHHDFWHTYTAMKGTVDLRCRLDCFGDAGLLAALGSRTGVNPASLGLTNPGAVFTFALDGALPGSIKESNGTRLGRSGLQWRPTLGRSIPVMAESETINDGSVALVAVSGGAGLLLVLGGLIAWWIRRRRRHRRMEEDRQRLIEAVVTPPS